MHHFLSFCLTIVLLTSFAEAQIAVTNHEDHSTVRYPVVLLRGKVPENRETLQIRVGEKESQVVRHQDHFKALVELTKGENLIQLKSSEPNEQIELHITYEPQTNPHYVRLVWLTDSSGNTDYATPDDDTTQDYVSRMQTAATLMQTFTAEKMHDLGLPRKTFRLERDEQGRPIVHTLKGDREADYYYSIDDRKWWQEIYQWINKNHSDPMAKNMVLAAYTRKDPDTGELQAHTALGGGNLGLFGSASIFSWPTNIEDAVTIFQDDSAIDATRVHDDSAGRRTVWGLASTTIGATLHEMGHTFDLPHCTDRLGIMTRGFDHFNRAFTFTDPTSGVNRRPRNFGIKNEAYFSPISATYLQLSPWFQLDTPVEQGKRPQIRIAQDGEIEINCEDNIAWVGFYVGPDIHAFKAYDPADRKSEIAFTAKQVEEILNGKKLSRVRAVSSSGRPNTQNAGQR